MIATAKIDLNDSMNRVRVEEILETNGLLTRKETAAYFRVTLITLWRWDATGVLRPIKIGGRTLYRSEDVKAFTRKMEGGLNG